MRKRHRWKKSLLNAGSGGSEVQGWIFRQQWKLMKFKGRNEGGLFISTPSRTRLNGHSWQKRSAPMIECPDLCPQSFDLLRPHYTLIQ